MDKANVTFEPGGQSVEVRRGATVLAAALRAHLPMNSPCGGQGRCGTCMVRATGALEEPTAAERGILSEEQLAEGWRLACQTRLAGDARVEVPEAALVIEHSVMVEGVEREIVVEPNIRKTALRLPAASLDDPRSDLDRVLDALGHKVKRPRNAAVLRELPGALRAADWQVTAVTAGDALLSVEAGDTAEQSYGVAVDIGTTTVAAYLCHLPTGEVPAVASDLNSQAQYGADVVSRIKMAVMDEGGIERLAAAAKEVINGVIERVVDEAGISRTAIYEIAVVGNTTMCHLFLGIPPVGLAGMPFSPTVRTAQTVRAADLGISVHPEGLVYVTPCIGGFVGADTVAVILANELDRCTGLQVAVDIGTNGEIVVARDGELYACSTAAGPALEGAKIRQGMPASKGAIDRVDIDQDVACHVIGEGAARGICGSGLVDAVAELVRVGVVTESGRMRRREEAEDVPEKVRERIMENNGRVEFVLARDEKAAGGQGVALTAHDIRETQLAKGALSAGITLLLEEFGAVPADVERLCLAGAFGNYIRRESALAIGLIPSVPIERIQLVGNAAGAGARLVLSSVSERRRAEELARTVRHVELSEREGFYDRFTDSMVLRPLPRED